MGAFARKTASLTRRILARREFSGTVAKNVKILGIETSCDDTGAAVVDETGKVLVESLRSQQQLHVKFGGIIPPVARDLHAANISKVVGRCLEVVPLSELDAVAVTNRPGLVLSLDIGVRHAKELCVSALPGRRVPLIPIHHMEAHALTVRMAEQVDFPFLVLLVSGGHSLLAVAESVDEFVLLGETMDDAPGEALDKVARRLKLKDHPECAGMSGGRALEYLASKGGDPSMFEFPFQLSRNRDCMFSFAGIKERAFRIIRWLEAEYDVPPDGFIPRIEHFCASFQYGVTKHLCVRTQRAMEYVKDTNALRSARPTLVSRWELLRIPRPDFFLGNFPSRFLVAEECESSSSRSTRGTRISDHEYRNKLRTSTLLAGKTVHLLLCIINPYLLRFRRVQAIQKQSTFHAHSKQGTRNISLEVLFGSKCYTG